MNHKVQIYLNDEEYEQLQGLAKQERRLLRDQIMWLVHKGLADKKMDDMFGELFKSIQAGGKK